MLVPVNGAPERAVLTLPPCLPRSRDVGLAWSGVASGERANEGLGEGAVALSAEGRRPGDAHRLSQLLRLDLHVVDVPHEATAIAAGVEESEVDAHRRLPDVGGKAHGLHEP